MIADGVLEDKNAPEESGSESEEVSAKGSQSSD